MSNVLTFTPRPRPVAPPATLPPADLDLRAHLEEAAATALDVADKIIAALDQIEENPSAVRIIADTRPTMVAAHVEPMVIPHEIAAPPEPITVAEPGTTPPEISVLIDKSSKVGAPPVVTVHEPLRWYGAGNVVSAAGITLLWLVARG